MKRLLVLAALVGLGGVAAAPVWAQTAISADGVIESTAGGFKFPDGSILSSAPEPCSYFGPGVNCAGQNLTGEDLSGLWAPGVNLAAATIEGVDFTETDVSGGNLSRVFAVNNLDPVLFHDAKLRAAVLRRANLDGAQFTDLDGMPLTGVALSPLCSGVVPAPDGADLMSATLEAADLRNSNFDGAYMLRANLTNAVLSDARFEDAELGAAILEAATLFGTNLSGACLEGADLSRAIANEDAGFSPVDLSEAVLIGANLRNGGFKGANLRFADLELADLSWANLEEADLCGAANLANANLDGTSISATTICPDGSQAGGDLSCATQMTPAGSCP